VQCVVGGTGPKSVDHAPSRLTRYCVGFEYKFRTPVLDEGGSCTPHTATHVDEFIPAGKTKRLASGRVASASAMVELDDATS